MAARNTKFNNLVPVRNVLITVGDKTGLPDFARGLIEQCPKATVYSLGGTKGELEGALGSDTVKDIRETVQGPRELVDVTKTLMTEVAAGLVGAPYDETTKSLLAEYGLPEFDMVVSNPYEIGEDGDTEDFRRNLDLNFALRAAGRNWHRVQAVPTPEMYRYVLGVLESNRGYTKAESRLFGFKKTLEVEAAHLERVKSKIGVKDLDTLSAESGYEVIDNTPSP